MRLLPQLLEPSLTKTRRIGAAAIPADKNWSLDRFANTVFSEDLFYEMRELGILFEANP